MEVDDNIGWIMVFIIIAFNIEIHIYKMFSYIDSTFIVNIKVLKNNDIQLWILLIIDTKNQSLPNIFFLVDICHQIHDLIPSACV